MLKWCIRKLKTNPNLIFLNDLNWVAEKETVYLKKRVPSEDEIYKFRELQLAILLRVIYEISF